MNRHLRTILLVMPALFVYAWFVFDYSFYQDDAYITFRYVANFLNGHGLVYNIGEYVEGYTNPAWVMYLAAAGALGLDFISLAKATGAVLGVVYIGIVWLFARAAFTDRQPLLILGAVLLVGCTQSLAYWAPAGLETAAFAVAATGAVYAYLRRSWLLPALLALAVWIRPEGAVVAGAIIIVEVIETRGWPKFSLLCTVTALIASLPFVAFKYFYYGSILPNPFYAKTSFDLTQLANGWEYTWRFLRHYGFYGSALFVSILFWRRLARFGRLAWLFSVLFMLYVTVIGGDVLKVHRFYLPIFGTMAIVTMEALRVLTEPLHRRGQRIAVAVVGVALCALTVWVPQQFVRTYNHTEREFTEKMRQQARHLKQTDSSNFEVATSTIGVFGFELLGHRAIDMLGLTDTTVAQHTEPPIPGMETTWKEAGHNSTYLLRQAPDYIVFSTGIRPTAPAEKALFLYRAFFDAYRPISATFVPSEEPELQTRLTYYKRVHPVTEPIRATHPVEYVNLYHEGLQASSRERHRRALRYFHEAIRVSPQPYNLDVVFMSAYSQGKLGNHDTAQMLLHAVLANDSFAASAHNYLYVIESLSGDSVAAALHRRWIRRLNPWMLSELDSTIALQRH